MTVADAGRTGGAGGGVVVTLPDGGVGCGKRGIANGFSIASAAADMAALAAPAPGISWFYSWSARPNTQVGTSYIAAGVEWVPMIWGHPPELTNTNLAATISPLPAGTKYLLGFNEPNFNAQSNLTPQVAAAAWPNVQRAADALGLLTVGPAMNFCGTGCITTNPFDWLDQFLALCTNCRIDFVAFHSYACTKAFFWDTYMTQAIQKYYTSPANGMPPRKIWVTEWACADAPPQAGGWTTAQIQAYMNQVIPLLEAEPAIFRYAWFAGGNGRPADTYVTQSNDLLAMGASTLTTPVGTTYTSLASSAGCP